MHASASLYRIFALVTAFAGMWLFACAGVFILGRIDTSWFVGIGAYTEPSQIARSYLEWTAAQLPAAAFVGLVIGLSDFRQPIRVTFWAVVMSHLLLTAIYFPELGWSDLGGLARCGSIAGYFISQVILVGASVLTARLISMRREGCKPVNFFMASVLVMGMALFAGRGRMAQIQPYHFSLIMFPRLVSITDTNADLRPDVFRFVRLERNADGAEGVFLFRYHAADPMEFYGFGAPRTGKFVPRFTGYRVHNDKGWYELYVGYCGAGTEMYSLQPDTDYELQIWLDADGLDLGDQIRVSLDSTNGIFWSEPFQYPKR